MLFSGSAQTQRLLLPSHVSIQVNLIRSRISQKVSASSANRGHKNQKERHYSRKLLFSTLKIIQDWKYQDKNLCTLFHHKNTPPKNKKMHPINSPNAPVSIHPGITPSITSYLAISTHVLFLEQTRSSKRFRMDDGHGEDVAWKSSRGAHKHSRIRAWVLRRLLIPAGVHENEGGNCKMASAKSRRHGTLCRAVGTDSGNP